MYYQARMDTKGLGKCWSGGPNIPILLLTAHKPGRWDALEVRASQDGVGNDPLEAHIEEAIYPPLHFGEGVDSVEVAFLS